MSLAIGGCCCSNIPTNGEIYFDANGPGQNTMEGVLSYIVAFTVCMGFLWLYVLHMLPGWKILSNKIALGVYTLFWLGGMAGFITVITTVSMFSY
jgi:hypothetical protein